MFFLAKGLGWGYQEIMAMPSRDRLWYVERLRRQIEHENAEMEKAKLRR